MARITLTLEVTDEQQAALINRFINEARATVSDGDDESPAAAPAHGLVDDRGVPWHPDYHAATQTKTAKGEWKKRKGADAAAIEQYERQYTVPKPPAAPAAAVEDVQIPAFLQRPAPTAAAAPVAPPAIPSIPSMPMPVPPAPATPIVTYDDLIRIFTDVGNRIGNERVASECLRIYPELGITDANALVTDETLRSKLAERLQALQ